MTEDLWYPTRDSLDTIAAALPAGPFASESHDEPLQLLVRDEALLESALATARQAYYPTVIDKAGALLRSMAKNHPFIDGNKRMAFVTTLVFLWANGYVLAADAEEAGDLVLDVAASQMAWEEVSARLSAYVLSLEEAQDAEGQRRELVRWQIELVPEFARAVRGE